ncbi:MAG: peptidylprolyl isomerase [Bacteroidota bacterium]
MKSGILYHILAASFLVLALAANPLPAQSKPDTVVFKTSLGDITIALFNRSAPITVKNFLAYVDSGFYNGTIFHRVIAGFVVQGGGYTKNMVRRTTFPPIKNESDNGLKNERGTLSMARTQDPNSATSQFFINLVNNSSLDFSGPGSGYAVFGKVIAGMEVVDKIAKVQTETRDMFRDIPKDPVFIISARRKP